MKPKEIDVRITFVLPAFNHSGGVKVVAIYAEKLFQRGHEVLVVAPLPRKESLKRRILSLISLSHGPAQAREQSHFDGRDVPHRLLTHQLPVVDEDVPDADVVVATWWETAEWVAALSPEKGEKIYFIQHHEVFTRHVDRCRATYSLPLHKIVISRWLKELMQAEYGATSVDMIFNSVDRGQFHSGPRGKQAVPTIGLLYSTEGIKSVGVAFDAVEKIRRVLGSIKVIAFGAETESSVCPLPEGTSFYHLPSQDSIRDLYGRCDVWICGSTSEGFHLPPLEAMACGCPVVSTKVGGPMDIIREGHNGYLVEVGDSAGLADRSLSILRAPEDVWRRMSKAAIETALSYSWDDATDLLEGVLRRTITKRDTPGDVAD